MVTNDLTGHAMAKRKGLNSRKLHMRGFFTRERDNTHSVSQACSDKRRQVVRMKCPRLSGGSVTEHHFFLCYLIDGGYRIKPASLNCKEEYKRQSLGTLALPKDKTFYIGQNPHHLLPSFTRFLSLVSGRQRESPALNI